jgi:hypothetical protein
MFYLFQIYLAFDCFMLQVQTAGVGVHEGGKGPSYGHRGMEEAQAAVGGVGRMHRPRSAVVEEVETSFLGGLKETGATPVWKRRGESSEQPGQRI